MLARSYLPHTLYTVAIISLSVHLVNQRKTASEERARVDAQVSILRSISEQLQSGKPQSAEGLERMKRLARSPEQLPFTSLPKESIGWKEAIFGRKASNEPQTGVWDQRDIDKLRKDLTR